jgi:hypothetical protein
MHFLNFSKKNTALKELFPYADTPATLICHAISDLGDSRRLQKYIPLILLGQMQFLNTRVKLQKTSLQMLLLCKCNVK